MMLELSKDSMRIGVGICRSFSKIFNGTLGLFHRFFKEIELLLQTDTCILNGQIDQLLLLPTLGLKDLGIY